MGRRIELPRWSGHLDLPPVPTERVFSGRGVSLASAIDPVQTQPRTALEVDSLGAMGKSRSVGRRGVHDLHISCGLRGMMSAGLAGSTWPVRSPSRPWV